MVHPIYPTSPRTPFTLTVTVTRRDLPPVHRLDLLLDLLLVRRQAHLLDLRLVHPLVQLQDRRQAHLLDLRQDRRQAHRLDLPPVHPQVQHPVHPQALLLALPLNLRLQAPRLDLLLALPQVQHPVHPQVQVQVHLLALPPGRRQDRRRVQLQAPPPNPGLQAPHLDLLLVHRQDLHRDHPQDLRLVRRPVQLQDRRLVHPQALLQAPPLDLLLVQLQDPPLDMGTHISLLGVVSTLTSRVSVTLS